MHNKLLIVSLGVFPGTAGSCIIVNNLAKAFGKDELVIFGQKPLRDSSERWPPEYPKLIYFEPFSFKNNLGITYSRWLSVFRMIKAIKKIVREENCTRILAVFPDELYMYAAYRASKSLDVPFYAWFHNTYLENRTGFLKILAKVLQSRFFNHAELIYVMSEGMQQFYKNKYPKNNFMPLLHGFELPENTPEEVSRLNSKVKFLFTGSLNISCLDASLRLIKVISQNNNYELHLYGNETNFRVHNIEESKNVFIHGFIPLQELEKKFIEYDIMLLPHGLNGKRSDVEYQTMFPTRTISLLYSNKPILAHTPKGAFLTSFLINNDVAEVVTEPSEKRIEEAINRLIHDDRLRNRLVRNAYKASKQFDLNMIMKQIRIEIMS